MRAAAIASLIATARLNGVEPEAYLRHIIAATDRTHAQRHEPSASIRSSRVSRRTLTLIAAALSVMAVTCTACDSALDAAPAACSDPDVLTFVLNHYRSEARSVELVAGSTTQSPSSQRDLLLCSVYVRRTVYDSARYGSLPKIEIEPRFFRLKTLAQGFEVTFGL